jgi:hypothetical protein
LDERQTTFFEKGTAFSQIPVIVPHIFLQIDKSMDLSLPMILIVESKSFAHEIPISIFQQRKSNLLFIQRQVF